MVQKRGVLIKEGKHKQRFLNLSIKLHFNWPLQEHVRWTWLQVKFI